MLHDDERIQEINRKVPLFSLLKEKLGSHSAPGVLDMKTDFSGGRSVGTTFGIDSKGCSSSISCNGIIVRTDATRIMLVVTSCSVFISTPAGIDNGLKSR